MWGDNDVTALAAAPSATGQLHAYPQVDRSQHVNFIEGSGHVHELYRSPDPARQWVDNDLTALAHGVPAVGSALAGYPQGDRSQHVNSIDGSGHVHELYRSPDPARQWIDNDLTALAHGGPAAVNGPLGGYGQPDGGQHVFFVGEDGHVHELYRNPDPARQWVDNDLTALSGGTPAGTKGGFSISPLAAYAQGDGSQHVNFVDEQGHVHELYRSPDPLRQWVDNDLTALSGAPAARGGLDAYAQADGSEHVNFVDDIGHVHELYRSAVPAAQWTDNDLTAFAVAAPAFVLTLDAYAQGDGSQHVNFVDADRHVHELYRNPSPAAQWTDNDLSAQSGAPQAEGDLTAYTQEDGSQHVDFVDINGKVHELYLAG